MKTPVLVAAALATVIAMSSVMMAQKTPTPGKPVASGQLSDNAAIVKPLVVSGKVSNDGKMLLTDIDSSWAISNSAAVRGKEGRLVTVKCYVDTEKNQLQILSVRQKNEESAYRFRQTDSAFRR